LDDGVVRRQAMSTHGEKNSDGQIEIDIRFKCYDFAIAGHLISLPVNTILILRM